MRSWFPGVLPLVLALSVTSPWATSWLLAASGPDPGTCAMTLPGGNGNGNGNGNAGSGSGNGNGNFNTGNGNGNFNSGNGNGNFNSGNGHGNFQQGNGQGNFNSGGAASPEISCLISSMQRLSAELSRP